jgi:hypothetical protein
VGEGRGREIGEEVEVWAGMKQGEGGRGAGAGGRGSKRVEGVKNEQSNKE